MTLFALIVLVVIAVTLINIDVGNRRKLSNDKKIIERLDRIIEKIEDGKR